MSNINKFLANILSARYGKDVRQSIHDAIKEIDNVADTAQNSATKSAASALASETSAKASMESALGSEAKAKHYMESAFAGTPDGYAALVEQVGFMDIQESSDYTIHNTKPGGYRLLEMLANTIQYGVPSPITPIPMLSTGNCVDLAQGHYDGNGTINVDIEHICSANHIPCKAGDVAKVVYGTTALAIGLGFFDENNNLLSAPTVENTNICEGTAPAGTKYVIFNIKGNGITPSNADKITLTINGKYLTCIKTHGKNFFAFGIIAKDVSSDYRGTSQILKLSSVGGDVNTVKCTFQNTEWSTGYISLEGVDGTKDYKLSYKVKENTTIYEPIFRINTTHSNKNRLVLEIIVNNDVVVDNNNYIILSEIQVEESTQTDYEPYRETIAYILTTYPMIKGSTLFRENGLVKAMHTMEEFVLKGEELWARFDEWQNTYSFYSQHLSWNPKRIEGYLTKANMLSTHFKVEAPATVTSANGLSAIGLAGKDLYIAVDGITTATDLNVWLAYNKPKIQYELATPIIETLDPQSQIALNGLETFEGVTIVEFDSRVQPLEFEAEVGTSQVGAYTLQAMNLAESNAVRINELAVAMVSL